MQIGDYIDDYCTRCKRTTDHAISAMNGEEPTHVTCRTCDSQHKYRHNISGRKQMTTEEAFNKVLQSVSGQLDAAAPPKKKPRGTKK